MLESALKSHKGKRKEHNLFLKQFEYACDICELIGVERPPVEMWEDTFYTLFPKFKQFLVKSKL